MARYSVRTGRWYRRQRPHAAPPLPRGDHRQWRTELPGGLIRIDIGEPVNRLPSEPQPVPIGGTGDALERLPERPADESSEAHRFAAMLPKDLRQRDWRRDYGLAKP